MTDNEGLFYKNQGVEFYISQLKNGLPNSFIMNLERKNSTSSSYTFFYQTMSVVSTLRPSAKHLMHIMQSGWATDIDFDTIMKKSQ